MNNGFYGFPNILGLLRATNLKVLGKAGATAGAGLAGGTTSGAPTSGSFDAGDAVFGQDGSLWICAVAGSPGTFIQAGFAYPLTTKADLLVGGAAGAASRLGVGSDNQVLTADSSQTLGVKWAVTAANAGGALTQIADTLLGSTTASITFSSIPGTFTHLRLLVSGRGTTAATFTGVNVQFNSDTGNNYDWWQVFGGASGSLVGDTVATSGIHIADISAANDTAGLTSGTDVAIYDYAATTFHAVLTALNANKRSNAMGGNFIEMLGGAWRNTAAITSITLAPAAGSFAAGSRATLYGMS